MHPTLIPNDPHPTLFLAGPSDGDDKDGNDGIDDLVDGFRDYGFGP